MISRITQNIQKKPREFSFERLNAWKESRVLCKMVYSLTSNFPKNETFGLASQSRRAAVSVSANLTEGSYRKTKKDRYHFYQMSYSSLMELLNLVILGSDMNYVNSNELDQIRKRIESVSALLNGLSKSVLKP